MTDVICDSRTLWPKEEEEEAEAVKKGTSSFFALAFFSFGIRI